MGQMHKSGRQLHVRGVPRPLQQPHGLAGAGLQQQRLSLTRFVKRREGAVGGRAARGYLS